MNPLTAAERGRRKGLLPQAMAAIIRGRIRAFGHCTPQDLLRDGFLAREILLNQAQAWRLAGEQARRAQLAAVLAATRRAADAPDDGGAPVPLRGQFAQLAALAGLGLFYIAVGGFCLAMGGAS